MTMDSDESDQEGDQSIEKHKFRTDAHKESADKGNHGKSSLFGSNPWIGLICEFKNRLSLNRAEKIALTIIASVFLALTVWATIWLQQKNRLANDSVVFKLPAKGNHAYLRSCSSYWKTVDNTAGIKRGAIAVPAATITLDDHSPSGALRVYFRDARMNTVGDPITIGFQDGLFSNGKNSIEISASDGFHNRVDFDSYQLGTVGAWRLEVLEASGEMEARANFSLLFTTTISPILR